jgi:hypothetical protein
MTEAVERKSGETMRNIVMSAAAPWLAAVLMIALAAILIMVGSDIGAKGERARIANECRSAKAFSVNRTGFKCEVIK